MSNAAALQQSLQFKTVGYDKKGWDKALTMDIDNGIPTDDETCDTVNEMPAPQSRPTDAEAGDTSDVMPAPLNMVARLVANSTRVNDDDSRVPRDAVAIDAATCSDDADPHADAQSHMRSADASVVNANGEAKLKQHGVPEQRGEPEPQSRLAAAARSRSPRPRGYQLPRESQAVHCDEIIIPRIRCLFLMCVIK